MLAKTPPDPYAFLLSDAARQVVADLAGQNSSYRWGVYHDLGTGGSIAATCQAIEQVVFDDEYGLSAEDMHNEFSPYDDRSVWNLIVHHEAMRPVGAVRYIVGPARRLKAVADLADYWNLSWDEVAVAAGYDPDGQFVEACTYSVLPEWRTADSGWPTKIAMSVQAHIMEELTSQASLQIINPRAMRVFKRWGVPFTPIADPISIQGADFLPVFLPTVRGTPWLATSDSEFRRLFLHRDMSVRGGTRLEPVDLVAGSLVQRHNKALFDRATWRAS